MSMVSAQPEMLAAAAAELQALNAAVWADKAAARAPCDENNSARSGSG